MRRPTLALAVAINRAVRAEDEWFDEPDDLDRVQRAISALARVDDPVLGAAVVARGEDVEARLVEVLAARH